MQAAKDEAVTTEPAETTLSIIILTLNFGIVFLPVLLWTMQNDILVKVWRFLVVKTSFRKVLIYLVYMLRLKDAFTLT